MSWCYDIFSIYIYIHHKLTTTKAGGPIFDPRKCEFCLVEPPLFSGEIPPDASSACSEPDLPQPVDRLHRLRCRRFEGTGCGTEGTQIGLSMEGHGIIGEPELKSFLAEWWHHRHLLAPAVWLWKHGKEWRRLWTWESSLTVWQKKNGNHQTLLGIWTLALGSSKMWENHVKNWNPSGETVHRESSSLPNPKYSWFSAQWTVSNTPKLQSSAVGKTWIFQLLFFLGPPKPAVGCLKLCSCELFGGSTGPPMNSLSNRWTARCGPKTHS